MTEDEQFDLRGAVSVVTGATRGIGHRVAWALGQAGARVVVVGRSSDQQPNAFLPGTVEEVVRELSRVGVDCLGVQADLSDPEATQRIVDETLRWGGRCDVIVNNAASTSNGGVLDLPWRRWQTGFRVQVAAPLQLCQGLVPSMLERGSGRVLNVSSDASHVLIPNLALYGTCKAAMERWNDYMHFELGGRGVSFNTLRVNRVVTTEGWHHVLETQGEEMATAGGGMSGLMSPEQTAEHVLWMLQQPSSWSGRLVDFDDVTALGGPPTPSRTGGD